MRTLALVALALLIAAMNPTVSLAKTTPGQRCTAGKQKVAGQKISGKLACYAKAKSAATSVSAACLARAEARFSLSFARLGLEAVCPGKTASLEALVDACVSTLLGDVPGNGKCQAASTRAIGRAGAGLMSCAAKDVTRPGSSARCHASQDTRLLSALARAGSCAASTTHADLHEACKDPVTSALACPFVTKWGSFGSGDGQLNTPLGVAVDSGRNVYVADRSNERIQKFDSSGTFLTKWGGLGNGDGQFNEPVDVAVDGGGNVYVVDESNHRIQKFNSSGTFLTKWGGLGTGDGQFNFPIGVGVDSSGKVYVADSINYRIQKFDGTGMFITKWGSLGTGDGQFNEPDGVGVDSAGKIYITESGNSRIQKFDSSGMFITKWGSSGSGDGQFQFASPDGLTADHCGNVYVTDAANNRIQMFDTNGTFITKWGSLGASDGQFNGPNDVAVDDGGALYVTDEFNHRIQKFACPCR